jgi:citrate lyase beta subunit
VPGVRQPVHTVYGGAHLFRADVARRLGERALATMDEWIADGGAFAATFGLPGPLAGAIHDRVRRKLRREPVEDFRIDFEDGYGARPDAEEDEAALSAAEEAARGLDAGLLPPLLGIRIRGLGEATAVRGLRTLRLFLERFGARTGGRLPAGFAVTLPKVAGRGQVERLARTLDDLEARIGAARGAVAVELMVETPRALLDADGRSALRSLVEAADGRCRGAHFGPYDYAAALGIPAAHQGMRHPACDDARVRMLLALAGTDVQAADGPTTCLPVPIRRAADGGTLGEADRTANREAIRAALRAHWDDARHSLRLGFWQGWDLHPAQLVSRYAAVYALFLEALDATCARLRGFQQHARRATLSGTAFDDAATARGLAAFLRRGLVCGAVDPAELRERGVDPEDLEAPGA